MNQHLNDALDKAFRCGLAEGRKQGRLDELVAVIRLVGELARDVSEDAIRLNELHRVQEVLYAEQKRLWAQEKP